VNGAELALDQKEGASLGEVLAAADELLEKAGTVIVALRVDGAEVDAESYGAVARRLVAEVAAVDIRAEDSSEIRMRAIRSFLELLARAKAVCENDQAETLWAELRAKVREAREGFGGLFPADELSFVRLFDELLERYGDQPDQGARIELSAQAGRISAFFGERLAELYDPRREMMTAASLFESRASELADIPILLQTGKEDQAMKVVLYFIEVFNKVIRVLPELRKAGIDTSAVSIGGVALPDFYGSFNDVLRELIGAFERKDAVLIGDLAEYEVLPRMREFFAAMREALPGS
jgi:hypothetical protein